MNPPGHHPDAKDFVAVNHQGAPYKRIKLLRHLFYKLHVTETYAWAKEVFSPFDGEVIKVENAAEDRMDLNLIRDLVKGLFLAPRNNKHDMGYFLGNHVVIKSQTGIIALLAHLKQGSVVVSEGIHVNAGDQIAQVGNSGNTIQPHLHFQMVKEQDWSKGIPIPFVFESCRIRQNRTWASFSSTLPDNLEIFRV